MKTQDNMKHLIKIGRLLFLISSSFWPTIYTWVLFYLLVLFLQAATVFLSIDYVQPGLALDCVEMMAFKIHENPFQASVNIKNYLMDMQLVSLVAILKAEESNNSQFKYLKTRQKLCSSLPTGEYSTDSEMSTHRVLSLRQ